MSAYNRQAPNTLKKKAFGSLSHDSLATDESGYASFSLQVAAHSLHNSTIEAPFLIERDNENENCRNAPNTHTNPRPLHFQTPMSTCLIEGDSTSFWHKSLSDSIENEGSDQLCRSPLSNQNRSATKRRKHHFQLSHSSPKKSKKQLFQEAAAAPKRRFYGGVERLDIIGMLVHAQPVLDCILEQLSTPTLDTMTKVSKRWEQAVYTSWQASERLQRHRFKQSLTKENPQSIKRGRKIPAISANQTMPLQPANSIAKAKETLSFAEYTPTQSAGLQRMDTDSPALEELSQRIKCPRCSKTSKVFRMGGCSSRSPDLLSRTMPLTRNSFGGAAAFQRFYSLDEVHNSPDENQVNSELPYKFAECTGSFCKFQFCTRCNSQPHPGEKCLVTELGTPSKFMMSGENVTPPKQRPQKGDAKLSRKSSLKRLCF